MRYFVTAPLTLRHLFAIERGFNVEEIPDVGARSSALAAFVVLLMFKNTVLTL